MAHSLSKEGLVESFSIEPTAYEDFKEAPDSLCTRVLLTDEAAKVHYKIFIQVRAFTDADCDLLPNRHHCIIRHR